MPEVCYRTGQAAKLLGRSSYEIRRLAESGLIGAEYSGKQWRIPAAEVERLRKDGVPEIPSSGMIGGNGAARPASNKSVANGLLAPPSEDLIDSTEDLIATENLLKKRRLERELEETEDWFRDREASDAERIAEQEDAAQARIDARQAEREKMKREAKWMRYALNSVPYEARGEMDLAIHNQVRAALGALHLDEPDSTVRRIIDGAVAQALTPWRRRNEIERAIEEARDTLPSRMQGYSWEPSRWDIEARRAAAKAIESARPGASFEELKAMAAAALRPLVAEFEHQQRCARIINGTSLSGATSDEQDEAKQAVADALAPLTIGTSEKEMESARDAALGPFRQRILQREADAHRAHLRRLDQAMRENIIAWASIPWGLPPEDKQRTVAAAQKAIDGLPEGTERRELEAARDRALQPFLTAHAQREEQASRKSAAESRLRRVGLSELLVGSSNPILRYLRELERRDEIEFRDFNDLWDTSKIVQQKIGPILLAEILHNPKMTDEQITDQIEKLVDEHLPEFLEA